MMYRPGLNFMRTSQEKADPEASWRRPDLNFFIAGACHILAYRFVQDHPEYRIIFMRPTTGDQPGQHVYVTDGYWALDANGWTPEPTLLVVTLTEYMKVYHGWECSLIDVQALSLEEFCDRHGHRRREDFFQDPWPRAEQYLAQLGDKPVSSSNGGGGR